MNKVLLFLIIVFCLTISACGKDSSNSTVPETTHIHDFGEWSVTKKATCSAEGAKERTCACGEKETKTIPATGKHDYVGKVTKEATVTEEGVKTYTCSVCGDQYEEAIEKVPGNWEIGYYVDELGNKTSDAYVIGSFNGKFCNSATSFSDLTAFVYLDKSSTTTMFRLLEYGSYRASALSSDHIEINLEKEDGSTEIIKLKYSSSQGTFYSDDNKLKSLILNNASLTCVIMIFPKYGSSYDAYAFNIDNAGLKELYNQT